MSKWKAPAPAQDRHPTTHRANGCTQSSDSSAARSDFDFDQRVVSQVDWSIWQAIYNGEFRLAVKCRRCGRWLTDGRSKRAHLGPRCAAKGEVNE